MRVSKWRGARPYVAAVLALSGVCSNLAHAAHSADTSADWSLSLSELLRVIQVFNVGTFGCAEVPGDADGFEPGSVLRDCPRHSADFEAPYWQLSLGELLRMIQFYNAGSFGVDCTEPDGYSVISDSADGECPRAAEGEGEGATEGEGVSEGTREGSADGEGVSGGEGGIDGEGASGGEGASEGSGGGEGADEGELPEYDTCAEVCTKTCGAPPPTTNGEGILVTIYNAAKIFPELNLNADTTDIDENGLIDRAHVRLLDSVLKNPDHPMYCCVVNTLNRNVEIARGYVAELQAVPVAQLVVSLIGSANIRNGVAGLATLGERDALLNVIAELQALTDEIPFPDVDRYDLTQAPYLAAAGDLDRDGICNLAEYNATVFNGVADFDAFVAAANDPRIRPEDAVCAPCPIVLPYEGEIEGAFEGGFEGSTDGEGEAEADEFPGCPALCEPDYAQGCDPDQAPVVDQYFAGPGTTDVTFIAFGDAETGFVGLDTMSTRANITAMNSVEGKLRWEPTPFGIDAPVDNVRGVVMAGDITRDGRDGRYNTENSVGEFMALYGLCGTRELHFPIYEGYGNHDYFVYDHVGYRLTESHPVADSVALRNPYRPGLTKVAPDLDGHYSWDWDNVHFVQVNLAPTNTQVDTGVPGDRDPRGALDFLIEDLEENVKGTHKRVIVISHYGFYSNWDFASWWTRAEAEAYADAISEYDVIAHIHGHAHQTGIYTWNGLNVFNVGSPYHNVPSWNPDGRGHFAIFRVTDDYLYVGDASWNALDPVNDIQFPDNWWSKIALKPIPQEGEGGADGEGQPGGEG
ncbi:MAG: hypothetical protein GC168_12000 [Candidatus Hydrogenedens sp.]|nr:hypothetical protein [Candidatus Hydrogenedens sp.]